MPHNLGVRALKLLDNLKALVKLGEDVHHGAGEQGMLRGLLELQGKGGQERGVRARQSPEPNPLLSTRRARDQLSWGEMDSM